MGVGGAAWGARTAAEAAAGRAAGTWLVSPVVDSILAGGEKDAVMDDAPEAGAGGGGVATMERTPRSDQGGAPKKAHVEKGLVAAAAAATREDEEELAPEVEELYRGDRPNIEEASHDLGTAMAARRRELERSKS